MIKVDARVKARADTLSGRTAFGDASESDAESDSRRFYAQQSDRQPPMGYQLKNLVKRAQMSGKCQTVFKNYKIKR